MTITSSTGLRSDAVGSATQLALPIAAVVALGVAGLLVVLSFAVPRTTTTLIYVGLGVCLLAQLWVLLVALSDGIPQLLLCLFVPFYSLFYLLMRWSETKWAFGLNVLGLFVVVGCAIAGAVRENVSKDEPAKPVAKAGDNPPRKDPPPAPPRPAPPRPEPKKDTAPNSTPKLDFQDPTDLEQPFAVDPKAKAAGKTVYLAALQPFAYKGVVWKYAVGVTGGSSEWQIKVKGREYKYGIGLHPPWGGAPCRVSFAPGGEFKRFKGWVAINAEWDAAGPVVFAVFGDDRKLWESGDIHKNTDGFDIDVTGVKVLTLQTRMKGGSNHNAHAVWLDPWLER